jgi:1,4-alpha-glucan branching enzyme
MVTLEQDGRLVFRAYAPDATKVEVVGAFNGWGEQRLPMAPGFGGVWQLELTPGPGEYLFRYLIDGLRWAVDDDAHGSRTSVHGVLKSRVWVPPLANAA